MTVSFGAVLRALGLGTGAKAPIVSITALCKASLKAGIGLSPVFISAGQETSPAINHVYHAIDELTKITVAPEQWKSSALALDRFVKEHEQIRQFCTKAIGFQDGTANVLDYPKIADEFVCGIRGD